MSLQYFTLVHILISLVGIAAGFGSLAGLLAGKLFPKWTAVFLATTMATSVKPASFSVPWSDARDRRRRHLGRRALAGDLRSPCPSAHRSLVQDVVISVVASLYFNVFVLVVQLFKRRRR